LIRLIVIFVISYLIYRYVKRLFSPTDKSERIADSEGAADEMVQDPYCKVYIPKHKAISMNIDGKELFFCSRECAQRYIREKNQ